MNNVEEYLGVVSATWGDFKASLSAYWGNFKMHLSEDWGGFLADPVGWVSDIPLAATIILVLIVLGTLVIWISRATRKKLRDSDHRANAWERNYETAKEAATALASELGLERRSSSDLKNTLALRDARIEDLEDEEARQVVQIGRALEKNLGTPEEMKGMMGSVMRDVLVDCGLVRAEDLPIDPYSPENRKVGDLKIGEKCLGLNQKDFNVHEASGAGWQPEMKVYADQVGEIVDVEEGNILLRFPDEEEFFYPIDAYKQDDTSEPEEPGADEVEVEVAATTGPYSPGNRKSGILGEGDECIALTEGSFRAHTNIRWADTPMSNLAGETGVVARVYKNPDNPGEILVDLKFPNGQEWTYPMKAYIE